MSCACSLNLPTTDTQFVKLVQGVVPRPLLQCLSPPPLKSLSYSPPCFLSSITKRLLPHFELIQTRENLEGLFA